MDALTLFIEANVQYAHFIIFGALLLAGLNIPVSEDVMIFISAVLASQYQDRLPHLFVGVYMGAYLSDLICYWLGRLLGARLFEIRFFGNMVRLEPIEKIRLFYDRYGIITLIFGRFIPFGIRNGLFLTAGLGKMNFLKFSLSDLVACTISTVTFFTLYYKYGDEIIDYVKKGYGIIFVLGLIVVGIILYRKRQSLASSTPAE